MATYSGSIGTVNVLDFASSDIFDDTQENPFLLNQRGSMTVNVPLCPKAISPRKESFVSGEIPLSDGLDSNSLGHTSPQKEAVLQPPSPSRVTFQNPGHRSVSMVNPVIYSPASATTRSPGTSPSRAVRQSQHMNSHQPVVGHENRSSGEEYELQKLIYAAAQLGIGDRSQSVPTTRHGLEIQLAPGLTFYDEQGIMSAPTSPMRSLWRSGSTRFDHSGYSANSSPQKHEQNLSPGRASQIKIRTVTSERQSRSLTKRKGGRSRALSAPSSPARGDDVDSSVGGGDDNSLYGSSRDASQGMVTFNTVKNLLRGGGALARTVHRDSGHRPSCMGTNYTISSKSKQRKKFERPTVITDASHRVNAMKLGTSPMKSKSKHIAFPSTGSGAVTSHETVQADPDMPSPKHLLHQESLVALETLDMIGTRHASPVHLIEDPLPDFSSISPRVDTWNDCKKSKKKVRLPSQWLMDIAKP